MEGKNIEHSGEVVLIDGDRIDVKMVVESACVSCAAKKACGMNESKDKVISLLTQSAGSYEVGEEVVVSIEQKAGIKAAVYSYMIPFFVILVVLFAMFEIGFPETIAGLSALGAAAVYYIFLFIFRKRVEKDIIFKIRKI